jgi:hypothetical protein
VCPAAAPASCRTVAAAQRSASRSAPRGWSPSPDACRVAVDGTNVETCDALYGDDVTVDLDSEVAETQLMDGSMVPKPRSSPAGGGLGTGKVFNERIRTRDWASPLQACWEAHGS